jgi:hypothetical protein
MFNDILPMKGTIIAYLKWFIGYCGQFTTANKELYKRSTFDDNYYLLLNLGI